MPSLSSHNHHSVLYNYTINYIAVDTIEDMQSPQLPLAPHKPHPKWERWLPSKLVIASTEDNLTSLQLKVKIETTDTAEVKSVLSLVDSGATGEFIDWHYIQSNRLCTQKLSIPILVHNVDGTLNKADSITEVVDLVLRYQKHLERTLFAITMLGKQKIILGHSWLCKHNLEIDWNTGECEGPEDTL